ncbi:vanadium-dependent haloperoxidase [Actinomadura barringtoniae]|uniref:Vanadium-dependent haloperoxidase n=1 Tax=Actinomadura barringtoniae TaxID=1427535 RepID=A0A939TD17_9ACTN|nr:vanadium-dependent haloperoxidase [Actinomadura barringtoniae]MBO2451840.1 vanadium-dependent haloperoxidase [Actinomadura barringtoniae]
MKRLVMLLVALMMVAGAVRPVSAAQRAPALDPVATWNGLALDAVRVARASDSDAARSYAMVNAAIYDAVNGIAARHGGRHRAYLLKSPEGAPPQGDEQAAAVSAAHAVLSLLYPDGAARFDQQLAADLAKLGNGPRVTAGRAWGRTVGDDVFDARAADGSRPVETQPAGSGPGVFPLAWPGAQYRNMTPFAVADTGRYVGSGPPALTSLDYAGAVAEIKLVGDARIDDPAKLAQFQYWSLAAGTDQPPGEWVKIALEVSARRSLPDRSRLLALLGVALSDVSISTARAKFVYRHWRPETAIQQADTDGNPYTDKDAGWKARAGSPGGTPEYVSGHSSFSGAGSAVLAGFFCADRVAFTHVTDSAPIDPATGLPMRRSYSSFSQAAADAGRSRVVGGVHFEFSNQAGLTMGRDLAAEVLAKKLLYMTGPTHHGECPL